MLNGSGIAEGRAIEKLLLEQKIVNEQIVEIMILSSKENVKTEQKLNSEPQPIIIPSPPAIGNTNVSSRLSNKDVLLIKEKILHCLVDDFKGNQAIFDSKEGWQVFNGTDLSMVMDSVVKGLKFAQSELNGC